MKDIFKIAGAFVGVLVGAGFASGQELLVFFVYFGAWGVVGTLLSAALFTFLGMALAGMGSRLKATCRIPDDCIDSKRYPLFIAREAMNNG